MAQADFGASAIYDPSVCDELWMNEPTIPLDLHTSCAVGCGSRVKELLADGIEVCDLDKPNCEGWTPLMYCSYVGHKDLVELLLDNSVDVNAEEPKYRATPLMLSASCGIVPVVSVLLKNRAHIDAQDKRGWTPLFYASVLGHRDVVKELTDNKADMELRESMQGLTPLLAAAVEGHVNIFGLLLDLGANLYSRTYVGEDALSLAHSHKHTVIVNLIEQKQQSLRNVPSTPLRSDAGLLDDDDLQGEDTQSITCGIHEGPQAFERLMIGKPMEGRAVSKPYPITSQSPIGTPDCTPGSYEGPHFYMGSSRTVKTATLQEDLMAVNRHGPPSPSHEMGLSPARRSSTYLPTIGEFLKDVKLERFISLFHEKGIDFEKLLTFSESDLQDIGVIPFGPRRKLFSSLEKHKSPVRPSSLPTQSPQFPRQENALQKAHTQILVLETQLGQEKQFHNFTKILLQKEQNKLQHVQEIATDVSAMLREALGNVQQLKDMKTLLHDESTPNTDLTLRFDGQLDNLERIIVASSEKTNTIAGNPTSPSPEPSRSFGNQEMIPSASGLNGKTI